MTAPVPEFVAVSDLETHFPIRRGLLRTVVGQVRAVDGISFRIGRGRTLGLVGESGCGKTTAGRSILRLVEPTGGSVRFDGQDIRGASAATLRGLRRRMQIVFQDPYGSLNPRLTVRAILEEGLVIHGLGDQAERLRRMTAALERTGMPAVALTRYPHEFSGGQRQRIGIARALALGPDLIVADEPISALDVSIQAQILTLLQQLRADLGLTMLFIAHDLAAVRLISDRIAVMYLGRIVELADATTIVATARHPYTQALLSAVPTPDPIAEKTRQRIVLQGEVPSPLNPPSGCPFHTRCPLREDRCVHEVPRLQEIAPGHTVACHAVSAPAGRG